MTRLVLRGARAPGDIAVIAPYAAQVRHLRELLPELRRRKVDDEAELAAEQPEVVEELGP